MNIFPFATNPNIQYGRARFWENSNHLDRIYEITAVYNLRMGTVLPVAHASKEYILDELEDESATPLNARSLLLGQLFLHTDRQHKGKTWKTAQNSRMPRSSDEFSEKMCVFVIAGTLGGHAR